MFGDFVVGTKMHANIGGLLKQEYKIFHKAFIARFSYNLGQYVSIFKHFKEN